MSKHGPLNDFIFTGQKSNKPLYVQLFEEICDQIISGHLANGTFLPSTRELAQRLGISRHTVLRVSRLLVDGGYVESSELGLRVHHCMPLEFSPPSLTQDANIFVFVKDKIVTTARKCEFARDKAPTANDLLGRQNQSSKLWLKTLIKSASAALTEEHSEDLAQLEHSISNYLNRFRCLRAMPDNIMLFSDKHQAINFSAKLLVEASDTVLVEDPGPTNARDIFESYGANISSVNFGGVETVFSKLSNNADSYKFLYVASNCNYAKGTSLSLDDRHNLLTWARNTGSYIIEDNFHCAYNHSARVLPPLQGFDLNDSVVYLSSFEEIVGSVCPLSFAVIPNSMIRRARELRTLIGGQVSLIERMALSTFINRGLLERQRRVNKRLLAQRRQTLIMALLQSLGKSITISTQSAGTFLTVQFKSEASDEQLLNLAELNNLDMFSTRSFYRHEQAERQFIIPFISESETQLANAATAFGAALSKAESTILPLAFVHPGTQLQR